MATFEDMDLKFAASGVAGLAVLYVPANGADGQTVTIGKDVYELDRAADGVTAGRIAVTSQSDDTPAEVTDALIAKINSSGTEPVLAIDIGTTEVLVVTADKPGGNPVARTETIAVSETLAGAGNVWSSATITGGQSAGVPIAMATRVPNATEVTLNSMHFVFPWTITSVMVQVRVTATNALKAYDGDVAITTNRVQLNNDGAVDFAATDTVTVIARG